MSAKGLKTTVRRSLTRLGLSTRGATIVSALSGGADSVALLDALADLREELGVQVVAAHLDHGLRPDSHLDAEFCRKLCRQLDVPLIAGQVDLRAQVSAAHEGLEQVAREARYAFLRQAREQSGAMAIAVAHTRDDQAETVLLQLLRGAGHPGLAAMRAQARDIIRPLLDVSRAAILRHLEERGLTWRDDPSNADTRLRRNRVRHELLPYLETHFHPRLRESLAQLARIQADELALLTRLAEPLVASCVREDGPRVIVMHAPLCAADPALARLVLRAAIARVGGLRGVAALHIERLLRAVSAPGASGRRILLPQGREARVHFGELIIGPRARPVAAFAIPLPVPGEARLPDGRTLTAQVAAGPPMTTHGRAVLGLQSAEGLIVRSRRPGDRLTWAGRDRSLKRFLMDRRVPAEKRQALPLVAHDNRVLWIPDQPIDAMSAGRYFVQLDISSAGEPAHRDL